MPLSSLIHYTTSDLSVPKAVSLQQLALHTSTCVVVSLYRTANWPSPIVYCQRLPSCMQVLHYNVDSMQEKLQYLREIGMGTQQVAHSISRLPQLLALDVRHNMRPKYHYLQSQMGGNVQTLCNYPAFFSLSLPHRYARTCLQVNNRMQCSTQMGPTQQAEHHAGRAFTCPGIILLCYSSSCRGVD